MQWTTRKLASLCTVHLPPILGSPKMPEKVTKNDMLQELFPGTFSQETGPGPRQKSSTPGSKLSIQR
jgi:hypothetical protein